MKTIKDIEKLIEKNTDKIKMLSATCSFKTKNRENADKEIIELFCLVAINGELKIIIENNKEKL